MEEYVVKEGYILDIWKKTDEFEKDLDTVADNEAKLRITKDFLTNLKELKLKYKEDMLKVDDNFKREIVKI